MASLEDTIDQSFLHIVEYQTNPQNPHAQQMIIDNARKYLTRIPGVEDIRVIRNYDSGRAVAGNDPYDLVMMLRFASIEAYKNYMTDDRHLQFVDFILEGYKCEGTTLPTREQRKVEFMSNILNAKPGEKRKAVQDNVPQETIVWVGERVRDFTNEKILE